LIFKVLGRNSRASEDIALVTTAGSVGGIVATACAFSFPTLYFLDPNLFNAWMAQPFYFASVLAALTISAGGFGLWIANVLENKFIVQEELAFPIGQLAHKMIAAQHQVRKAYELMAGFASTVLFCLLQDGFGVFKGFIPKSLILVQPIVYGILRIPLIRLDLWPMLWAIGFVTGHVIALPLAVGVLSKIFVIGPLNYGFFPEISRIEFILAFCSGMVVSGALFGFIKTPQVLWKAIKKLFSSNKSSQATSRKGYILRGTSFIEIALLAFVLIGFLTYFEFSPLAQLYLIVFTFMCTHEIASQAGKIGLARLGAFATFVMVPAMLMFKLSVVQIVLIATFVEICGGVAADILFGRKLGRLANIPRAKVKAYQYLGLVVSALCIGAVFWLLIKQFGLGSSELFAQKAKNRQLLIDAHSFNYYVLVLGFVFGLVLKKIKVNPSLVLGGILMPINVSLGLVLGGLCTMFTKNKEEFYPFWSGVFASNSIWMIIRSLL